MSPARTARPASVLLAAALLLAGCGDDDPVPTTGTLEVTVTTTGPGALPAGYSLLVGDGIHLIGIDEALTFEDLVPDDYGVELTDVPPDCEVAGENPRSVTVEAGQTSQTSFQVTCVAEAS